MQLPGSYRSFPTETFYSILLSSISKDFGNVTIFGVVEVFCYTHLSIFVMVGYLNFSESWKTEELNCGRAQITLMLTSELLCARILVHVGVCLTLSIA